ncbi:hypothetical protein K491DRAFT_698176, partial [Lophiostoma macrostomum CBS 122681]
MVSTRHHPREFPASEASPRKKTSRNSTLSPAPESPTTDNYKTTTASDPIVLVRNNMATSNSNGVSKANASSSAGWSHTASNITIAWIVISLPLVIWDSLYILLRPHTMEGGKLQWPIWKPYEIYAAIDHVYGWPGWNNNDGFGGAQGAINAIEAVLYGLYLAIVWNHGKASKGGRGVQVGEGVSGWVAGGMRVEGRTGNRALVIGFTAAVMTLSKTLLYCEYIASMGMGCL